MDSRAGRRLVSLLAFVAGTTLFLAGATDARAGDVDAPGRAVPRTVPVARTTAVIPLAQRPMTALQLAARHGLRYSDARTFVLLESTSLRVRIYPGTSTVVVAGRRYRVKDLVERRQRDVILSRRVAGFLDHRISAFRADERVRAKLLVSKPVHYEPLPPLPVRPKPVKRAPKPLRTANKPDPAPARPTFTGAERAWVPPAADRRWKWIVIHHSDDTRGNVAKYDDYHRNVKKWEHGCGYHFVIGNGTLSGDGEVEMGPRWIRQLHGAHAKTPDNRFNDYGVGICLVGDFNIGRAGPTAAQLESLVRLVRWLRARYGIELANVQGHCDCCSTACPGKNFPWDELRRRLR